MNDKTPHNKILIIEDDVILSKSLSDALRDERFDVTQSTDGEDGFRRAMELRPDLILLDIKLPRKNGLDVLKDIRGESWGTHLPVIVFTVVEPDESVTRMIAKYEPSYYLVKTKWGVNDIVERVKEIIAERYPTS